MHQIEKKSWYFYKIDMSSKTEAGRNKTIPWIVKQIKAALKTVNFENLEFIYTFRDEIFNWVAKEKPKDLMTLSPFKAVELARHYAEKPPSAEVVLKLEGGWTLQELTTKEQLEREGNAQGTCVGNYCDEVHAGETSIYSLRDSKGRPRVTIEIDPETNRVMQVLGKGNNKITQPSTCSKIIVAINDMGWKIGAHHSRGAFNLKRCFVPSVVHKAVGRTIEGNESISLGDITSHPSILVYTDGKPHMIVTMEWYERHLIHVDSILDDGVAWTPSDKVRQNEVLQRYGAEHRQDGVWLTYDLLDGQ